MSPVTLADPDKTLTWWIKMINQVGFPMLVALILLYFVLSDVPTDIRAARADLETLTAAVAHHQQDTQRNTERLSRIMQQICVNTAQTAVDRERCFPQ